MTGGGGIHLEDSDEFEGFHRRTVTGGGGMPQEDVIGEGGMPQEEGDSRRRYATGGQ